MRIRAFWCIVTTNCLLCTSLHFSHSSFNIFSVGATFCTGCCPYIRNVWISLPMIKAQCGTQTDERTCRHSCRQPQCRCIQEMSGPEATQQEIYSHSFSLFASLVFGRTFLLMSSTAFPSRQVEVAVLRQWQGYQCLTYFAHPRSAVTHMVVLSQTAHSHHIQL